MMMFSYSHHGNLLVRRSAMALSLLQQQLPQQHAGGGTCCRRLAHTVRIIATADLPHGKAYQGDVIDVKAGYARNYLIPKKIAVYATRQNFERLGLKDPDRETLEEKRARLDRQAAAAAAGSADEERDLKAADTLRYYLRNKVVCVLVLLLYYNWSTGCFVDSHVRMSFS